MPLVPRSNAAVGADGIGGARAYNPSAMEQGTQKAQRPDRGLIQRLLDDPDQHAAERRATRLLRAARDEAQRCSANVVMACVLLRRCADREAAPLLESAIASPAWDDIDELLRIHAWMGRAKIAFLTTHYADAIAAADIAMDIAQDCERREESLLARAWKGAGLVEIGRYEDAVRELNELVHDAAVMDVPAARGQALNYLAVVNEETDEFEAAERFYRTAEEVCREHNPWAYGRVLANYGDLLVKQEREAEAQRCLTDAIRVLRSNGDYGVAGWCHWALGRMHMSADRDALAREHYELALSEMEEADAPRLKAEAYTGLGLLAAKQNDYAGALTLLETAMRHAEAVQAQREVFIIHHALASVHEQFGDQGRALYHHKRFHALRSAIYDELGRARLSGELSQLELERARSAEEIWRLRHVELKEAHGELLELHRKLEHQAAELREASIRDPLTSLFNRRYFDEQLAREVSRADRYGSRYTVAMCDLDEFKEVNDRYSHAAGDKVLLEVARCMREVLRVSDVIARYGGEEFAILLPNTDAAQATMACEKLRERVAAVEWARVAQGLQVTISAGVASGQPGMAAEEIMQLADRRLYTAKRAGRDRVVAGGDG